MPELPEVEAARQLVENHCLNKKIEGATVAADDSKSPINFAKARRSEHCVQHWDAFSCELSLHADTALALRYGSAAEVIEGISSEDLQALLSGKHIKTARRKGKHLWLTFDRGPAVMFHFGMPVQFQSYRN